jgi:hypothetical protein
MTSSVPNGSPNKCHQLAEDCLQRAIMASSVELADQWLRIAGTWLAMEKFKRRRSEHAVDLARMDVPGAGKSSLGSSA